MEPEIAKSTRGAARMHQFEEKLASQVQERVQKENKIAKTQGLSAQERASDSMQNKTTMDPTTTSSSTIPPVPPTTAATISPAGLNIAH